jgi:hypothetical protein
MANQHWTDTCESLSKSMAAVLVPVLLGVAGYCANGQIEKHRLALEQDKINQEMLTKAIDIVFLSREKEQTFGVDASLERRRAFRTHWLETYNKFSKVEIKPDLIAIMMEQDTRASEKHLWRFSDKPGPQIAMTGVAAASAKHAMGDGWVSLGRFGTKNYADLNFDILPENVAHKTVMADTKIRARWSVSLRTSPYNMEDRQGYSSLVRGLVWGGECAKVLASLEVHDQTWAFIDLVECDEGHGRKVAELH